ncbi:MAG: hypothetical protein Q4C13_02425, partial [Clostridia bacterium]|nr:hypothetical protein [Clostridia bacterium]
MSSRRPEPPRAVRICGKLGAWLAQTACAGTLHSVFDRAANIETASGLVSVLAQGRALLPRSILLDTQAPFPAMGWERGLEVRLDAAGIYDRAGAPLALLSGAEPLELFIYRRVG